MKVIKKILLCFAFLLFLFFTYAFWGTLSGVMFLLATALCTPIEKFRLILRKCIGGKIRVWLPVIFGIVGVLVVPIVDDSELTENSVKPSATPEIVETTLAPSPTPTVKPTPIVTPTPTPTPVITPTPAPAPKWWTGVISEELAAEIEAAFIEIGEDPSCFCEFELKEERKSGLFYQRWYRVWAKLEVGPFDGGYDYWIVTREWFEGEPERKEYPREFLTAIKYYEENYHMGDNLWMMDGGGTMQDYSWQP